MSNITIIITLLVGLAFSECTIDGKWVFASSDTTSLDNTNCVYDYTAKVATLYYKDGHNQIAYVIPYNGIYKRYYESGALYKEGTIKNGKRNGTHKWYYESGALQSEFTYKNDKLNGIDKEYYESGALEWERTFKDGKLNGTYKEYYENGRLKRLTKYRNGKFSSSTYYNRGYTFYGKKSFVVTYETRLLSNGMCEEKIMEQRTDYPWEYIKHDWEHASRNYYGRVNEEHCM